MGISKRILKHICKQTHTHIKTLEKKKFGINTEIVKSISRHVYCGR